MKSPARRLVTWCVYATAFVPLALVDSFIFPAIVSKMVAFSALVLIMVGAWSWRVVRENELLTLSYVPLTWGALTLLLAVTSLLNGSWGVSFWGEINRMEGVFLLFCLLFWLTASVSTLTKEEWKCFLVYVVWVGALVGVVGFFQYVDLPKGIDRVDVLFLNSLYLAEYLMFVLGIAIYLAVEAQKVGMRWAYGLIALLTSIVVIGTASRSALLGILVGAFAAAGIVVLARGVSVRTRFVAAACLVLPLAIAFSAYLGLQLSFTKDIFVLARFSEVLETPLEEQPRYLFGMAAFEGFKERPWGWGTERFRDVADRHLAPEYARGQVVTYAEQWPDRVHNAYLELLVSGGILAVLIYVSLLVLGLLMLYRDTALSFKGRVALSALLIAYAVQGLFVFDTLLGLVLLLGTLAYIGAHSHTRVFRIPSRLPLKVATLPIMLFVVVCSVGIAGRMMFAHNALEASRTLAKNPKEGVDLYGALIGQTHLDVDRRYLCGDFFLKTQDMVRKGGIVVGTKEFDRMREVGDSMRQPCTGSVPVLYLYRAGSFFRTIGATDEAVPILVTASERSPEKPLVTLELARARRDEGDRGAMQSLAKSVYERDTKNTEAAILYAAGLLYAGSEAEANKVLMESFGTINVNHPDLVRSYVDLSRYKDAEAILKGALKNNEKSIWARLVLAEVEYRAGNRKGALSTLEKGKEYLASQQTLADALRNSIENNGNFSVLHSW